MLQCGIRLVGSKEIGRMFELTSEKLIPDFAEGGAIGDRHIRG
jgi:hypothetical protein